MGWQVTVTWKKRTSIPLPLNVNTGSSWIQMKRTLLTFLPKIREMVSRLNINLFSLLNLDTQGWRMMMMRRRRRGEGRMRTKVVLKTRV